MRLHRVNPRECICIRTHDPRVAEEQLRGIDRSTLLELTPRTEVYIPVSPLERAQYPIDAPRELRAGEYDELKTIEDHAPLSKAQLAVALREALAVR
jgi:hypothetical protein